jgi:hypothetical protein
MSASILAETALDTAERLKELARAENVPVPQLAGRAVEEYVRSARFPGIVFITGGSGQRKARLMGGTDVWSVIFIARCYDMDVAKTAEHLELPGRDVELALAYYRAYPEEIDQRLREMEEADADPIRLHPRVEVMKAADLEHVGRWLPTACASLCLR